MYKVGDYYRATSTLEFLAKLNKRSFEYKIYSNLGTMGSNYREYKKISYVGKKHIHIEGVPYGIPFSVFDNLFVKMPGEKESNDQLPQLDMTGFFSVASSVKERSKEKVALHLSAESGEIAECLIQPERGGDLVEESVDAILCALDLIYLEMRDTAEPKEIVEKINNLVYKKLSKWYITCKPTE